MMENLIQVDEPMEHRGIVVAPLFPRVDPVAAYVTLDKALAGGLRIRETSESGTVLERLLEERRALREETARQTALLEAVLARLAALERTQYS